MVQLLAIMAVALLSFAGYCFYLQIRAGLSTPNMTTWVIGLIISLINCLTFYTVVGQDPYKGAIMFTSLATMVVLVPYSFMHGKFAKPAFIDVVIFLVAIFIGVLWRITKDDRQAQFLVQIIIFVANLATVIGLWRGKLQEYWLSWSVAILAYTCAALAILVDYNGNWLQLFGPILNGIIANGATVVFSFRHRKEVVKVKTLFTFKKGKQL